MKTPRKVPGAWPLLLCVIVAGIALDRAPLTDASARLERLPTSVPGATIQETEVTAGERQVFGAARIFRREILTRDQGFVLTVIDGTANRHALHDPYYCVQGAGYQIARTEPLTLQGGSGSRLTVRKGTLERTLIFYFSDGQRQHASPLRAWLESSLRRLSLGSSGAAPVLVLVEPLTTDSRFETLQELLPQLKQL